MKTQKPLGLLFVTVMTGFATIAFIYISLVEKGIDSIQGQVGLLFALIFGIIAVFCTTAYRSWIPGPKHNI
jgi:hypothetical protein